MSPIGRYAAAAALTLLIEVPLYVALARAFGWAGLRRALAAAVGVNVITHPVLYAVSGLGEMWFWCGELAVVVVEGALLTWWWRAPPALALASSTLANGLSLLVGALLLG